MTLKDHLMKTAQNMRAAGKTRFSAFELCVEAKVEESEKSRADQTTSAYLGKLVRAGLMERYQKAGETVNSYGLTRKGLRYRPLPVSPSLLRELQRMKEERLIPRAKKILRYKDDIVLRAAQTLSSQGLVNFTEAEIAETAKLGVKEATAGLEKLMRKGKLERSVTNFVLYYSFPARSRRKREPTISALLSPLQEISEEAQVSYFARLLVEAVKRLEQEYGGKSELDAYGDLVRLAYTLGAPEKVSKWLERSWFVKTTKQNRQA